MMCLDEFNLLCRQQYYGMEIIVYDEFLLKTSNIVLLSLAFSLCEWTTRRWIFQEQMLASELHVITEQCI